MLICCPSQELICPDRGARGTGLFLVEGKPISILPVSNAVLPVFYDLIIPLGKYSAKR